MPRQVSLSWESSKMPIGLQIPQWSQPQGKLPSPLYWGKLSGAGACWTWRTARCSLHKAWVLTSLEHTAPSGPADVQSSWEAVEDNMMTPVLGRGKSSAFPCAHTPEVTDKVRQSWATNQGASLDHSSPLRQSWRATYPITSYEFSLPHFLLRKLSPQSPPHKSAREREDSCEIRIRPQEHLQMFQYLYAHQKLADSCQLQIILASYHCHRHPWQLVLVHPPLLQCFWEMRLWKIKSLLLKGFLLERSHHMTDQCALLSGPPWVSELNFWVGFVVPKPASKEWKWSCQANLCFNRFIASWGTCVSPK